MRLSFCCCIALLATALVGCQPMQGPKDYTAFRAEAPRSILIVPVVNKSAQVDAPDTFLSTLPVPLAERGYYVFPVNMIKRTMEDDGLSDADMVFAADPKRLASLFGADAVLYASIDTWTTTYIVLSAATVVDIHYVLKSGKTGAVLWEKKVHTQYSPQASSGNLLADLIADAIVAAMQRAHPNYIPLAVQANTTAFYPKGTGLLAGPYDPSFGKDQ
jgi:hypothetical protein